MKLRGDENQASPYAGRWVARVQGKVIANGGTPRLVRLAAQTSRHKERLEISFVPPEPPMQLSPVIDLVGPSLGAEEIYLAGGAVRDALLGRESHDFDFAVRGNAIALARRVAAALKGDFYVLDPDFDAGRVILRAPAGGAKDVLDFSSFRGPDVEADLAGRDFTINAIALDLRDRTLLDPLNGTVDLGAKIIRECSENAIGNDPVRILRAVRQAAAFGFRIESRTREALRKAASLLADVSAERQRDELFRILSGPRPDKPLKALEMLGALQFMLPELSSLKGTAQSPPHFHDVWEHTLSVIAYLDGILGVVGGQGDGGKNANAFDASLSGWLGHYRPQLMAHLSRLLNPDRAVRSLLFFSALYHDVSKPAAQFEDDSARPRFFGHEIEGAAVAARRAQRFNLSNDEISRLKTVIGNHMRFGGFAASTERDGQAPSRSAIYRFYRDVGQCGIDLIMLGLADLRGTWGPNLSREAWSAALETASVLMQNYWEKPEESVRPPRLVDGNDIMRAFGLEPGPIVGEVLEAVREAQAAGAVSSRKEALAFGQAWLGRHEK